MAPKQSSKRAAASANEETSTGGRTQKKTRFVSPSDDPANFAEEVDAALETPGATRKGRVRTEGYDSDSSDDGEGVVLSRKTGAGGGDGGDDDDMFAMSEKDGEAANAGGAKKKAEEFLRLGDIEGQEFNDASGSDESESEGEPEDEDDAERRKKAGMGYELSSFNMREEMEEGKFAADGTFVRTFDPHAMHDRWMEGMDEREIKRARRAKRAQERAEKERIRAEARESERTGGKDEVQKELVAMLKKGETVLEALTRLGTKVKKTKQKEKKIKGQDVESAMDVSGHSNHSDPAAQKSQIDHITALASTLLALGDVDIYSKTYEHLLRAVRSGGNVSPTWEPPSADVKYEYKWDVPQPSDDPGTVFGPFSEEDMKAWYHAQYFGATGEKVKVRPVGGDWGDWDDIVE